VFLGGKQRINEILKFLPILERSQGMPKNLLFIVLGILLVGVVGCSFKTPEIRGIVLDAETKQPVEGAWVRATLEIKTKTVGGDVHTVLSVDTPHTRTDKQGKFVIPSKSFKKPTFPVGFGTEVESFDISAKTVDRIGGIGVDINDLNKKEIGITIYIRSIEKIYEEQYQKYLKEGIKKERALELIEGDYFSSLQSLYRYCLTGRSSVEVPPVEGDCDEWELDYAITKHKRYLERYKKYADEGKAKGYFATLEQLTYLYEKKGDFEKAIKTLRQSIALMERRGLLKFKDWQRDKARIEQQVNKLQQKL
jgi:hypothetical protein